MDSGGSADSRDIRFRPYLCSLPNMRLLSAILLALVWSGAFLATHLPKVPGVVSGSDKVLHALGFLVLAAVLGLFLAVRRRFAFRWLAAMLAVLAVYAAFDEITQMLVPNRYADWRDWVADIIGAVIGTILVGGLWWAWSRRSNGRARR